MIVMQLLREAAKHRASARNPFVCIDNFVLAVPGLQQRNQRSSGKKKAETPVTSSSCSLITFDDHRPTPRPEEQELAGRHQCTLLEKLRVFNNGLWTQLPLCVAEPVSFDMRISYLHPSPSLGGRRVSIAL